MDEIGGRMNEAINEQGNQRCVRHGAPHFLFLKIVPLPTLTRIFCRFQQISLMLTLRSKVTQPRRKNLYKKENISIILGCRCSWPLTFPAPFLQLIQGHTSFHPSPPLGLRLRQCHTHKAWISFTKLEKQRNRNPI